MFLRWVLKCSCRYDACKNWNGGGTEETGEPKCISKALSGILHHEHTQCEFFAQWQCMVRKGISIHFGKPSLPGCYLRTSITSAKTFAPCLSWCEMIFKLISKNKALGKAFFLNSMFFPSLKIHECISKPFVFKSKPNFFQKQTPF